MKFLILIILPFGLLAMDFDGKILRDCEKISDPSMKNGVVTVGLRCKWSAATKLYGEMEYLVETKASCSLKNYDEKDLSKCVADEKFPIQKAGNRIEEASKGSKGKVK